MARFNTPSQGNRRLTATSPVKTTNKVTKTFEGGKAYVRDAKSELFQLAVVNMVGQDAFYESGEGRDVRYQGLVQQLAVSDPEWTYNLLKWLRGPESNLRTASLVGAAEFVRARLDAMSVGDLVPDDVKASQEGGGWNRKVVEAVLLRADEPGEMLGYWISQYGRKLPKPVKRGVADAVKRLYTQRGFLRYDSASKGFRFADVLELVHAQDSGPEQDALYRYAVDDRHDHAGEVPELLHMVRARRTINTMSANDRHKLARLALRHGLEGNLYQKAMAGQWEWLHSSLGDTQGVRSPVSKADQWRLVLPQLGIMALVRNLRNLEEAGLGYAEIDAINARLMDADEIAKSRMFPFRFWQAYQAINGDTFKGGLERAFAHSMSNIPKLPGKSLVLVDTSASMTSGIFSQKSSMSPVQAAAVFGVALATANPGNVHLVGFASGEFQHDMKGGATALQEVERFVSQIGRVGHGTDIHGAVRRTFKQGYHDRVFIISDMQTIGGYDSQHTQNLSVPVYGFNLGGYSQAMMETGKNGKHEFGGLTDATFKQVPLLEMGVDTGWPWEPKYANVREFKK
jgi:TROVE domain.